MSELAITSASFSISPDSIKTASSSSPEDDPDFYKKHTVFIDGQKHFVCLECKYSTRARVTLLQHLRIHSGENPYACTSCAYRCKTQSNLKKHTEAKHGHKQHICTYCGRSYSWGQTLAKHLKVCPLKPSESLTESQQTLTTHSKTDQSNLAQEAPLLPVVNQLVPIFQQTLLSSLLTLTPNSMREALMNVLQGSCNGNLPPGQDLSSGYYQSYKLNKFIYKCTICTKKFLSRAKLSHHLRSHGYLVSRYCKFCSFSSPFKSALIIHSSYRHKFFCSRCNMVFNSISKLRLHKQFKHNQLIWQCRKIRCGFSSTRKLSLRAHQYLAGHLGKNLHYKCTRTGCTYKTKSMLKFNRHKLTHKNDMATSNLTAVKRSVNSAVSSWSCIWCAFTTSSAIEYSNHVLRCNSGKTPQNTFSSVLNASPSSVSIASENNTLLSSSKPSESNSLSKQSPTFGIPSTSYGIDMELSGLFDYVNGDWVCRKCNYKTGYKQAAHSHLRTHSNSKPFKCPECAFTTKWRHSLKQHIRTHKNNTSSSKRLYSPTLPDLELTFQCQQCEFRTRSLDELASHHSSKHRRSTVHYNDLSTVSKSESSELPLTPSSSENSLAGSSDVFACKNCTFTTTNSASLKNHQRCHSDEKYVCIVPNCNFSTRWPLSFRQHTLMHSGVKKFVCPTCNYGCNLKAQLNVHLRIHSSSRPYACNLCSFRTKWSHSLKLHLRSHANNTLRPNRRGKSDSEQALDLSTTGVEYKCEQCGYVTYSHSALKVHSRTHSDVKPYVCDVDGCNFKTKWRISLKHHELSHSSTHNYKCSYCDYRCNLQHTLSLHMRKHSNHKPYACPRPGCSFRTKWSTSLRQHKMSHTGEKRYKCTYCDYACNQNAVLQQHVRKHTNETPYSCEVPGCQFKTIWSESFRQHVMAHSGITRYHCPDCDYSCNSKPSLRAHIRKHSTEKPFVCPQCSFATKWSHSLRQHIASHSNVRSSGNDHNVTPIEITGLEKIDNRRRGCKGSPTIRKCPLCSYTTKLRATMQVHLRIHSDERPFACTLCPFKTKWAHSLRSHKKSHLQRAARLQNNGKSAGSLNEPSLAMISLKSPYATDATSIDLGPNLMGTSNTTIESTPVSMSSNNAFPSSEIIEIPSSFTLNSDLSAESTDRINSESLTSMSSSDDANIEKYVDIASTNADFEEKAVSSTNSSAFSPYIMALPLNSQQKNSICSRKMATETNAAIHDSSSNIPNATTCSISPTFSTISSNASIDDNNNKRNRSISPSFGTSSSTSPSVISTASTTVSLASRSSKRRRKTSNPRHIVKGSIITGNDKIIGNDDNNNDEDISNLSLNALFTKIYRCQVCQFEASDSYVLRDHLKLHN